jgi:uncharacterized DUF497 family protein
VRRTDLKAETARSLDFTTTTYLQSFLDDYALLIDDSDESAGEQRFILLGSSAALRHLVVCHCYRESDTVIRIISARKAAATEREEYRQRWVK